VTTFQTRRSADILHSHHSHTSSVPLLSSSLATLHSDTFLVSFHLQSHWENLLSDAVDKVGGCFVAWKKEGKEQTEREIKGGHFTHGRNEKLQFLVMSPRRKLSIICMFVFVRIYPLSTYSSHGAMNDNLKINHCCLNRIMLCDLQISMMY